MRVYRFVMASMLVLGGCSDESDPGAEAPDAAPTVDANPACPNPTSVLPSPWNPIDTVSTGEVTDNSGTVTIDATAGGTMGSADNPFTYLSFGTNSLAKVDITDVDSYQDKTWDLAIKRTTLRINGGDSGPGGAEIAIVDAGALADVSSAPSASEFAADDWVTDDCQYVSGLVGEPETAIGTWYDYDAETFQLTPFDQVYVLQRADGTMVKFKILNYYHNDTSGYYEIEWAAL